MEGLGLVFLTGLLTGGVTCALVQGGLLASLLVRNSDESENSMVKARVVGLFLVSKLIAYTILGAFLGWLGSRLTISPTVYGGLQVLAGLYMLGVVAALFDIHPIFRYFLFQTPRAVNREIRRQSKSSSVLAPILLGIATVLIPCGTTQAVMAQVVLTGSLWQGALTMAVFTLGTMPLFVLLGLGIVTTGAVLKQRFQQVAGVIVSLVALMSINGGLILLGSPLTPSSLVRSVYCTLSFCPRDSGGQPSDTLAIEITGSGYTLDHSVVKAGSLVTVKLTNKNATGCQQAFSIPALGISKIIPVGSTEELTFTAPDKPGVLVYSCSMGMYSGQLEVI